MPLTLAGIWFIVAGLGLVAPAVVALIPIRFPGSSFTYAAYAPTALVILLGTGAALVGSAAAYVTLARAGFPHGRGPMTLVTIGLAVVYPLLAVGRFFYGFGSAAWTVVDVIIAIAAALLLVFAISAARNRILPLGFRIVPGVQFVLAVLDYIISYWAFVPVTGITFIGVGAAYIILAANAREALEAAADATPDERRGRAVPTTTSPANPQ